MFGFPSGPSVQGVDLSEEEKGMPLKKYIETIHQQLNEQVQEFSKLSEEAKQVDQVIYNAFFGMKDCFNQIAKIYDQQLQHQQDMNTLSQEQLSLANDLIAPATELDSAKNLFNIILRTQQMNEWLAQQVMQDAELYETITDTGILLSDVKKHIGT